MTIVISVLCSCKLPEFHYVQNMNEIIVAQIRQGLISMRKQMLIVSPLCIGLGVFMVVLHAFDLDPDAGNMSSVMVVLLYAFALLFIAVGVLGLWVAFVRQPRQAASFLQILEYTPMRIRKTRIFIAQTKGAGAVGQRFYVQAETDDGTTVQIATTREQASAMAGYIAERAGIAVSP